MSDFQAASEDSSGGIADPPPEGLNLDIECLVDSFVAAGCLSLFKLAEAPGRSKDTFSTIHRGDGCGKPLSQTFSFGGTIRFNCSFLIVFAFVVSASSTPLITMSAVVKAVQSQHRPQPLVDSSVILRE